MAPPKRALFSLNVDSNAEHIASRIEDHSNKDGKDRVKLVEDTEPTSTSTSSSVQLLSRPIEKTIERTVENIIDGKVIRDGDREVTITTETSRSGSGSGVHSHTTTTKKGKKSVDEQFDTSDL